MTLTDLKPQMRVAYVDFDGSREYGTVDSWNKKYAMVRIDKEVGQIGWIKCCELKHLEAA